MLPNQATNTIVTQFIVQAGQAINDINALNQAIQNMVSTLQTVTSQTSLTTQQASTLLTNNFKAQQQQMVSSMQQTQAQMNTNMNYWNTVMGGALNQIGGQAQGLIGTLSSLGGISKFVFGTVLGVGAVKALREVVGFFKEAIEAGLLFNKTLYTFEVAVRGLQRAGLEGTIEDWKTAIMELKKQFPIFNMQELTQAASLAGLMTREFGFTTDQIMEVVKMSSILAELTGKDLYESVRGITYAIGSGYFESLQRAGINISRQVVAQEALARGYKQSYNALDQNVRAMITYQIIQKNLNAIQADAGRYAETTAGKVDTLTASWENLKIAIGTALTSMEGITKALTDLNNVLGIITEIVKIYNTETGKLIITLALGGPIKAASTAFELFTQRIKEQAFAAAGATADMIGLGDSFDTITNKKNLLEYLTEVRIKLEEAEGASEELMGDLIKLGSGPPTRKTKIEMKAEIEADTTIQEQIVAVQELLDQIVEAEEEMEKKKLEIRREYENRLLEIQQESNQAQIELELEHTEKINEINADIGGKEQKIIDDTAKRLAEEEASYARRRAEAEERYRLNELQAERQFQEDMRRLREDFMMNLEDAVRERDALQIIRLTREYNLNKDRLEREYELERQARAENFALEMKYMALEHEARMAEIAAERQDKINELALETQERLAEEERRYAEEQRLISWDAATKRTQAQVEQAFAMSQLQAQHKERLDEINAEWMKEHKAAVEWGYAIRKALEVEFGPGGYIEGIYQYFLQMIANMYAAMNQPSPIPNLPPLPGTEDDYQHGGILYARRPTTVTFGGGGPELATFQPLNKMGTINPLAGLLNPQSRQTQRGMLKLELLLSPDLEANIIDSTLNEVSDVIMTIERERR